MADQPASSGGGGGGLGGTLKAKLGPWPVWIWLALITAVALAWWLYEQHKAGSTASTTTPSDLTPADVGQPGVVVINQDGTGTTTGTTPPPEPKTNPGGHIGPGSKPSSPGIHEYQSTGKESLAQVAKQHNTTPADIEKTTRANKNNISKQLSAYFSKANWNKPIPKGDIIVYKNG